MWLWMSRKKYKKKSYERNFMNSRKKGLIERESGIVKVLEKNQANLS